MATKNINCQLVLAVGSQAIQRFNFISTVNLYWLWVHKPFNVSTLYQLSTCIGCGFTSHSTFQLYINQYQLSTCIGCGFTSHSTFQLYINCQLVLAVGSQAIQRFNFISTVNLYWLWVHKPFNVSTLYQLSTCICCGFTSHSTFQLYINQYQLSTCIGCGFTSHSTFQLYINCQLVLAVGSQAIQRFNFISTNFQPSTDNVNWFCCNTDNSTLVLHCISKYMKSS